MGRRKKVMTVKTPIRLDSLQFMVNETARAIAVAGCDVFFMDGGRKEPKESETVMRQSK